MTEGSFGTRRTSMAVNWLRTHGLTNDVGSSLCAYLVLGMDTFQVRHSPIVL